jgi:hypothetical protein
VFYLQQHQSAPSHFNNLFHFKTGELVRLLCGEVRMRDQTVDSHTSFAELKCVDHVGFFARGAP